MRRTGAIALAIIGVLAGCSVDQDPYPLPPPPPGSSVFHPVALGETVTEAVVFIEARRGEHVEILSAAPIGTFDGARVELFAAPLVAGADGDAVVGEERHELEGVVIGELADASADSPADTVAIVAEVTASVPGRYVLSEISLSYRLNGAPERSGEGIDVVLTVCADDPEPTVCDDDPT
jgi:hypothetical protein